MDPDPNLDTWETHPDKKKKKKNYTDPYGSGSATLLTTFPNFAAFFFVMKNTIEKAIFGLSTCRKVSTTGRELKCLKRHFWISGTVIFIWGCPNLVLLDLTSAPWDYFTKCCSYVV